MTNTAQTIFGLLLRKTLMANTMLGQLLKTKRRGCYMRLLFALMLLCISSLVSAGGDPLNNVLDIAKSEYYSRGKVDSPEQACGYAMTNVRDDGTLRGRCVSAMATIEENSMVNSVHLEDQRNGNFPTLVATALDIGLKGGDIVNACVLAYRKMGYAEEDETSQAAKCNDVVKTEYLAALRSGKSSPIDCDQWAIVKGGNWVNSQFNMQYSPLSQSKNPVIFGGQITDATEKRLVVYGNEQNGIIQISTDTKVFNADKIRVGGDLYGYGTHIDHAAVNLADGRATTIPVISAACVD